jgi:hypothetical protein
MNKPMLRRSIVSTAAAAALAVAAGDARADFSHSSSPPSLTYSFADQSWSSANVGQYQFGAGYSVEFDTSAGLDGGSQPTASGHGQVDIPATFFSQSVDMFRMSGDVDVGAGTAGVEIDVLGQVVESRSLQLNQGLSFPFAGQFVQVTADFDVGPIPVTVTAIATGILIVQVLPKWQNDTLEFQVLPSATVEGALSAGTGASYDGYGASAGVDGSILAISLGAPLTATSTISSKAVTTTVKGNLQLRAMSGNVSLDAWVNIPVIGTLSWTQPIYNWNGLSWSVPLFNETSTFNW